MTPSHCGRRLLLGVLALSICVSATGVASAAESSKPVPTDPTASSVALGVGLLVVVAGGVYQLLCG